MKNNICSVKFTILPNTCPLYLQVLERLMQNLAVDQRSID